MLLGMFAIPIRCLLHICNRAFVNPEFLTLPRPGETLPLLPRATHGLPDTGLREMATINRVISNIPADAPDHDVENARALRKVPYDGNRQAKTITCGGGDNYHPCGERGFTTRELACLQTFPLNFRFQQDARPQIGNAVPPLFAKAIYGEIIRSLRETDKRELSRSSPGP